MEKLLKEFVKLTENKKNKQNSLHIRKTKLKESGLDIEDLLNTPLHKKIKQFERG